MTKSKLILIPIILSILFLYWELIIEREIYIDYINSTGKTRALFGLKDLLGYSDRYFIISGGIINLVMTLILIKYRPSKFQLLIGILISTLSIILPFLSIWKIFV
jgi:hypothetical protein